MYYSIYNKRFIDITFNNVTRITLLEVVRRKDKKIDNYYFDSFRYGFFNVTIFLKNKKIKTFYFIDKTRFNEALRIAKYRRD